MNDGRGWTTTRVGDGVCAITPDSHKVGSGFTYVMIDIRWVMRHTWN